MANTMDKLRELAEWVSNCAEHGDGCLAWAAQGSEHDCPCGLKEARELAKDILREEAQGDAGAVASITDEMRKRAKFIDEMSGGDDFLDMFAEELRQWADRIDQKLAASATPRTEPAEGREACPRDCGCVVHCRREQLQAITTPPAGDGARVTDVMVREALAHCPHDLPPPARWEWIADKINAYMTDPSQMDRDDAESDARVAAFFAARETSNGARVTELLRDIDDVMREFDDDAVCDHAVGVCWCNYREVRRRIKAALAARDAQGDSNE